MEHLLSEPKVLLFLSVFLFLVAIGLFKVYTRFVKEL